jgi:polar amino acid transport system substrate-binding protein
MQLKIPTVCFALCLIVHDAMAEKISMLFAHSYGPYIIEQDDSGVEIQIIREALAVKGYELVPVYTELNKLPEMYLNNRVDAIQTSFNVSEDNVGFYGNVAVEYQDVFLTLEERHINIKVPEDLKSYSLLAFQNAHLMYPLWLPTDFEYSQTAKQIDQVRLLQLGLVDVVLSDKNIFNYNVQYYRNFVSNNIKPMRMHYFSPPFNFGPLFKSEKVAQAFDQGIKQLKDSGRYAELISTLMAQDPALLSN